MEMLHSILDIHNTSIYPSWKEQSVMINLENNVPDTKTDTKRLSTFRSITYPGPSMNFLSQIKKGFSKVGGMDGLWEKYGTAIGQSFTATTDAPTTAVSNFTTVAASLSTVTSTASNHSSNQTVDSCFKLTPYWGNLVRPLDDPDYPWLGLWTSLFITSVWYFCTDQVKCHFFNFFSYFVY